MQTNTSKTDLEYGTRHIRRAAVKAIHTRLVAIRAAEQRYLDNVPDNFQGSESFETGENAVDTLDEVIDLLAAVY